MSYGSFRSASGLRPTTAFFGVAIVLVVVLVRAVGLAVDGTLAAPRRIVEERLPEPDFDILDRHRRVMARSVLRLDLGLSPRAMWQAHTPELMAVELSNALGGRFGPQELLERMLPDAVGGVIRVQDPLFDLDFDAARRVQTWIGASGIEGLWIERAPAAGRWTLCWEPAVLLSPKARERAAEGRRPLGPLRFARRLAQDLARCVLGERAVGGEKASERDLVRQHDRIWRALMPTAERTVIEGLDTAEAARIVAVLRKESVEEHQMSVRFHHERRYPLRESGMGESLSILGSWRFLEREQAQALAARELGLESPGACPPELWSDLGRRSAELLDRRHPSSGLEGLASTLLASDAFGFAQGEASLYRYRRDRPAQRAARRYYLGDWPESETPRVVSTIDSKLQAFLRQQLEELLRQHDPALAMGIALDVATGEVLAVDGASPYETSEFLPTWHQFTPGSTFKVLVMALALESGGVTPSELFNTFDGHYPIPGSRRVIREAEGPPGGWRTASEALAFSINAVMVQVGARVPQRIFRDKLARLGYGIEPRAGAGVERSGHLPKLPWKPAYEQASVSFGHELLVSLWQHAAGLATVVRGGEYLPLRLLAGVEWGGEHRPVDAPLPARVISSAACAEVRRMMKLGAEIGTGRHLWKREVESGTPLVLLTKTGTAEKVPTEVCLHLELERNRANKDVARDDPRWISFQDISAKERPHRRSCYTSSIVVVGSVLGSEREVLVLLVVDEPRGKSKYGSEVAGPAAVAVLKEALGLTSGGRALDADGLYVPPTDYASEENPWDRPWAEQPAGRAQPGREAGRW